MRALKTFAKSVDAMDEAAVSDASSGPSTYSDTNGSSSSSSDSQIGLVGGAYSSSDQKYGLLALGLGEGDK